VTVDGITEPHAWEDSTLGLRLVVLAGGAPRTFRLPEDGIVVLGRGDGCAVRIDDASVSREHAHLHVRPESLFVEDLGSSNGTRVAGRRLGKGERAPVGVNELFELGRVVVAVKGHKLPEDAKTVSAEVAIATPGTPMAEAYALAELVAPTPVCVLLLGETGVGKTAAAERIHRGSGRSGQLVKLNCAAVPEALLEGELFGYERGAFTGAQTAKAGLIEAASGGTLLLDEIGDMPLATQAKLLHAVEHGEVMRLGALKPRPIDVRFLAATHRDLPEMVAAGTFRADLYYRINGITITIPALRDRRDEIVSLAEHFLATTCAKIGRPVPALRADAKAALLDYPWPGNIRELRNVMDRVALLARDREVGADALGLGPTKPQTKPPPGPSGTIPPAKSSGDLRGEIDHYEKERIVQALEQAGGNQAKAAQLLGLPLRTFVKRLTRHGLTRARRKEGD